MRENLRQAVLKHESEEEVDWWHGSIFHFKFEKGLEVHECVVLKFLINLLDEQVMDQSLSVLELV